MDGYNDLTKSNEGYRPKIGKDGVLLKLFVF